MAEDNPESAAEGDGRPADPRGLAGLRERWESLPTDPDPADDLGYETVELDVLTTSASDRQVILMPKDEALIEEDTFVVIADEDLCELIDWT